MRLVLFDLETGGLEDRHPDIQLAAVALDDLSEVESFEAKIWFDVATADPKSLAMNSWNVETWDREAKPEADVVVLFSDFLRRHSDIPKVSQRTGRPYSVTRIGGHNAASFDAPRLQRMFQRSDAFLPADSYRPLDTMQLALWESHRRGEQLDSYRLESVCDWLGIEVKQTHDALADVRLCAEIVRRLLGPRGFDGLSR